MWTIGKKRLAHIYVANYTWIPSPGVPDWDMA
jgi:hypothetical protein